MNNEITRRFEYCIIYGVSLAKTPSILGHLTTFLLMLLLKSQSYRCFLVILMSLTVLFGVNCPINNHHTFYFDKCVSTAFYCNVTLGRRCRRVFRRSLSPAVRLSVRRYRSNPLRISSISHKIGGVMYSTMEQIAIRNGHAGPMFAWSTELWNFPW